MRSEFNEAISEHNPLYKEGLSHDQFYKGAEWAWQHQQSKVDELQKQNAWLSGVANRENKRANKLQEENVSTTVLLGKTIQEKNELQKRVDDLTQVMEELLEEMKYPTATFEEVICSGVRELEQALKGGSDE